MSGTKSSRLAAVLKQLGPTGPAEPLTGGNNASTWLVDGVVVRLLAAGSIHDRGARGDSAVLADIARRAAATGASPQVMAYLPEQAALVLQYVPGQPLTDASLRDPAALGRVGTALRRLHSGAPTGRSLDMHGFLNDYSRAPLLPAGWTDALPRVRRIIDSLADGPTVLCHGDLVAGNMVDDGQRVWLIDVDDAVDADPAYDLGGLWVQAGLDEEHLGVLLDAYGGDVDADRVLRWALVVAFAWTAWSRLRAQRTVPPGYDPLAFGDRLWGYAGKRLTDRPT
jgi:aminoglycoside phosphotransferase